MSIICFFMSFKLRCHQFYDRGTFKVLECAYTYTWMYFQEVLIPPTQPHLLYIISTTLAQARFDHSGHLKVLLRAGRGGGSYGTTCIVSITFPQFNFKSLLSSHPGDNVLIWTSIFLITGWPLVWNLGWIQLLRLFCKRSYPINILLRNHLLKISDGGHNCLLENLEFLETFGH